jgi:hypothetical protein
MLFRKFFKPLSSDEVKKNLVEQKKPGFILRRSATEGNISQQPLLFTIYSDQGEALDKKGENTPFYYTYTYTEEGNRIRNGKFATYETDPEKISEKFFKTLSEEDSLKNAKNILEQLIPLTKEEKNASCQLIHMHHDAKIRPEEKIRISDNLRENQGFFIITTQTPSQKRKQAQGAQPGKTSLEMERLLSKAGTPHPAWIIITGHGKKGGAELSGVYMRFGDFAADKVREDIPFSVDDYVHLLIDGGLKKGVHINILLNVCYGAEEEQDAAMEPIPGTSFAERLLASLAKEGITATVIASITHVDRFTGKYLPDEKEGHYLKFRAEGGFENIRIYTSSLPDFKISCQLIDNDILIGQFGILTKKDLEEELKAEMKESVAPLGAINAASAAKDVSSVTTADDSSAGSVALLMAGKNEPAASASQSALSSQSVTSPVEVCVTLKDEALTPVWPALSLSELKEKKQEHSSALFQPRKKISKEEVCQELLKGNHKIFTGRPGKNYIEFKQEDFKEVLSKLENSDYSHSYRIAGRANTIEIFNQITIDDNKEEKTKKLIVDGFTIDFSNQNNIKHTPP